MKFKAPTDEFGVMTKTGVRRPAGSRRKPSASAPAAVAKDPIRSARGLFVGGSLTAALLASRAEERRRG
jgi:hypothetical protein